MKNTFIFDLDGTLIDTLDSLELSVNYTLDELKLPRITKADCRNFVGNGARFLIEKAIDSVTDSYDDAFVDLGLEVYGRVFAKYCTYNVAPYDGILDVLSKLKSSGATLAVLSNKPHNQTVEIVEKYFGVGFFSYIQGQKDDIPRKPDPRSIDYALKELGTSKEFCVYIGDSEVDMKTGISAEIQTIGVSWGFRDRDVLEKFKTPFIVDSPKELLDYITKTNLI